MNRKVLNEISRVKELMGIISEQVVTDYDGSYDYKKEGDKYYTKKKGTNNWIEAKGSSLNAIKSKVFGDSSSSSSSSSSSKRKSPFKNKEEGDKFRKWVNDTYPKEAKEMDLDVSGSHTNSYIMRAWAKYGNQYKEGKSNTKKSGEEPNPNLVVSSKIADKFDNKIDFNNLNTQDTTEYICDTESENCAQFVNNIRKDLTYVGNAWDAYNNSRLGETRDSAFDDLDEQTRNDVIKLWLDIHNKRIENGNSRVKDIVSKIVPRQGEITDLKVNDIVGLFYPRSTHHEEAFYQGGKGWFKEEGGKMVPGDTIKRGDGWGMNTHIGTVAAIKDGVPLIFHNVGGNVKSDPPSKLRIAWVKRPEVEDETSIINKITDTISSVSKWFTNE